MEQCGKQFEAADAPLSEQAFEFGPFERCDESKTDSCCLTFPECETPMILHKVVDKPSWHDEMNSGARPSWYRMPGSTKKLAAASC